MDTFWQIAQLILSLSILVTLHEAGHFIAARMFGIKVEKFYLFFDVKGWKLFSFTKGDTEYGIGWLPLGGYVKIAGMIDESMDTEQMEQEPQEWEFRSKKPWQKLIVMLGGIIMNVVLGIIIFICSNYFVHEEYLPVSEVNNTGIYVYEYGEKAGLQTGDKLIAVRNEKLERWKDYVSPLMFFGATYTVERNGQLMEITLPDTLHHALSAGELFIANNNFPMLIDSVVDDMGAANAGIQAGDLITGVDGKPVNVWGDFLQYVHYNFWKDTNYKLDLSEVTVALNVERDGRQVTLNTQLDSTGKIGALIKNPYELKPYTFGGAISMGTFDAFNVVRVNAIGLKRIITGQESATKSLSGPIKMATLFKPPSADADGFDWAHFWKITGLLSMILALMNLLPIPALDGGHCVIVIIEWIRGKPISDKWMMRVQTFGLILVIGIMLFACGNDIWSMIKG